MKSGKTSPDEGSTKSDIMTERKVVEQKEGTLMLISPGSSVKPARIPGHHYIEADRYLIDVNAYADDPCADLSDRVDHDGYQNVTDCIVKTYMRANRYFTEFMDARRKGRDFDLAAAEREQPPVHSLDDIISQLIAGAAQRSAERKPSSDDIQKNLQKTLNRFMSGRGLAI